MTRCGATRRNSSGGTDVRNFIAVNLWQSEHDAVAGRAAIGMQVQRLLEPLMATPSQLLGADEVVATDLADHR